MAGITAKFLLPPRALSLLRPGADRQDLGVLLIRPLVQVVLEEQAVDTMGSREGLAVVALQVVQAARVEIPRFKLYRTGCNISYRLKAQME